MSQSNLCTRRKGATPYNGLYGEAPPEKGTIFRLHVYKRVRISPCKAYERVGKLSVGPVKDLKGLIGAFMVEDCLV